MYMTDEIGITSRVVKDRREKIRDKETCKGKETESVEGLLEMKKLGI